MNPEDKKKLGVVILAIAAGLIAAIMTGNYIRQESTQRAKEYEQKRLMPLVKEIEGLKQENQQIRSALQQQRQQPAMPGEMMPKQKEEAIASLASITPVGKRAVTIQINPLSAVGGLVHAGNYVDVLARLAVPRKGLGGAESRDTVTTIVFQNVQVLAVGPNVGKPGSYAEQQNAKSLVVTLAMDPKEAGLMTFVQEHGDLQMFLRSPGETETYEVDASNWQTLAEYVREHQGVDIRPPAPKPVIEDVPEEERQPIQIFRGGQEL